MLETTRLKLVPLSHEQLLLYKNDFKALCEKLGITYQEKQNDPATLPDLIEALDFWINNTKANPDRFEWFTNWEIILKEENVAIGGIGFAGFPDEEGKTMVGYGLDLRYHGKGYATEALSAIIKWSFMHEELKIIIADTPLLNAPSQKVLLKNSFSETGRNETLIHWGLNKTI